LKYLRYAVYSILALLVWVIIFFLARSAASDVVRFLAFNITNSYAFPNCQSCLKFEWDVSLQIMTYSVYIGVFLLIAGILKSALKYSRESVLRNRLLALVFVMSFPTHTLWGVASICGGFGVCSTGYYFNVMVPVIMSNNPLAIAISVFIAYRILILYSRKNGIVL